MDTDLLDLAAAQAGLLCRGLAVEVAGLFPVVSGELRSPVLLGTGGPCSVRLAPSDLFRAALLYRADQLVIVHNHLDDGPPSEADRRMIGHVIVGRGVSHVVD